MLRCCDRYLDATNSSFALQSVFVLLKFIVSNFLSIKFFSEWFDVTSHWLRSKIKKYSHFFLNTSSFVYFTAELEYRHFRKIAIFLMSQHYLQMMCTI